MSISEEEISILAFWETELKEEFRNYCNISKPGGKVDLGCER
jgi:hypothetical protein